MTHSLQLPTQRDPCDRDRLKPRRAGRGGRACGCSTSTSTAEGVEEGRKVHVGGCQGGASFYRLESRRAVWE